MTEKWQKNDRTMTGRIQEWEKNDKAKMTEK